MCQKDIALNVAYEKNYARANAILGIKIKCIYCRFLNHILTNGKYRWLPAYNISWQLLSYYHGTHWPKCNKCSSFSGTKWSTYLGIYIKDFKVSTYVCSSLNIFKYEHTRIIFGISILRIFRLMFIKLVLVWIRIYDKL